MIKKVLFSFVILFSFISCQIGLGEAIDLQPPKVQLTSHNDNDSVAQTFTLKKLEIKGGNLLKKLNLYIKIL